MPILLQLTAQNVDLVLGNPDSECLYRIIPEVFERLLEPGLDEFTRYTYCKSFHDRLASPKYIVGTATGLDSFADICVDSGIVETFLRIAKGPKTVEKWPALAAHFALQSMWMLMRKGTADEREALLEELLENDVVDFCLDTVKNSPLAIHRQGAVGILKCLAAECTLGASLSPAQTSKIITRMCEFILSGPQFFVKQLGDLSLTWQSFLAFGKFGTSSEKARRYAPRSYAMAQENAAWTIQGLFLRCPPPNSHFCYEVLKHDPYVIDLLFMAAAVRRPPWYADLEVDSTLCETLAMIFRLPDLLVPGLDIKVDDSEVQDEKDDEWDSLTDCLKLLTSRPNWVGLLLGVWNHIEAEKPHELKKMLMEAESKYFALAPYDPDDFYQIFEFRGSSRICIERLIATLTYASDRNKLSQDDIFCLLRITNAAVLPLSDSPKQCGHSDADKYRNIETDFELCRKPMYAVLVGNEVEAPLKIANEPYMGPTAHVRLLTLLAKSNILGDPSKISQLPGSISTQMTLAQLKQICTSDSIRKVLCLCKTGITARREVGHERFREDEDLEHACFAYATAAELAAALVNFNDATRGAYQKEILGVRREQVLCLGNAAEMALGQENYDFALCYATAAVQCAESLPTDDSADGVNVSIRDKNRRRVARASAGISEESS